MKRTRRLIRNLQTHIIAVFSILLFFSFFMVGFIFNLAVNFYVTSSSAEVLSQARAHHLFDTVQSPGGFMRIFRGDDTFVHRSVSQFKINSDYNPISMDFHSELFHVTDVNAIAYFLESNNIPLDFEPQARIRMENQVFYISILPELFDDSTSTIFFMDVTDLLQFTSVVNRVLVLLVVIIWVLSIIAAGFLADTLVKPMRKIRDFVSQIGKGDFTQQDFKFSSDELHDLNQSLNIAAKQLATYDNDQKTFFQNVSHELRTPLMSIKSYAEGIKYGIMNPKEASEIILTATDSLKNMVDDILYVSRIDNLTSPEMAKYDLFSITMSRARHHEVMAQAKNISLEFDSKLGTINIMCVPSFIERAIDNLISNAVRYAKKRVTIRCFKEKDFAVVTVIDDGPGFETEALPQVFERFYSGKNGMTGIGLAIVRSITDQHGGISHAENNESGGAVLTIKFPRED